MRPTRHILVPVDGSEGSKHAAYFAGQLATALGSDLTLLHIVDLHGSEVQGLRALDADAVQATLKDYGKAYFQIAGEAMGALEQPLHIREEVEIGDPGNQILLWARTNDVDHIVMGSRGRTPLQELMLGSVSEKVVRRAPCPVTVVR